MLNITTGRLHDDLPSSNEISHEVKDNVDKTSDSFELDMFEENMHA